MKRILIPLLLLFISATLEAQVNRNPEITSYELYNHVSFLASDSLKGREPGTVQDKIAAKYIRDEFRTYGLTLLGNKGYQFFSFKHFNEKYKEQTHLAINGQYLHLGTDFSAPTANGSDSLCADAVFVGLGRSAKDYKGVRVRKKWAVIYYPLSGYKYEYYNKSISNLALEQGAAGIILVSYDSLNHYLDVDLQKLPNIPIFILSPQASELLLGTAGISPENVDALKKEKSLGIVKNLNIRVCGKVAQLYNNVHTQNVVAMLKGSDPKLANEYIVIGAHYDHLGMGTSGGSRTDSIAVHNGADDNASGVVAILEMAHKLNSQRKNIKRSIVFVAFGAEEKGLIGSQWFVDSAIVPIENIKAMINIDMIGRLRENELEVHGTKTSLEADSILNALNADSTFRLSLIPEGMGPSDHASFYSKNIPVFFIHTGLHEDYHTPKDDVEFLNIDGMQKVTHFTYRLAYELSTMPAPLTFTKSSTRSLNSMRSPKIKVKLGIMPDVSGANGNGIKVIGVTEGKPANLAGIKSGDIILSINGMAVKNIYDYTDALSTLDPGATAIVVLQRDGQQIEVKVEL